jgi:hypothetical protein
MQNEGKKPPLGYTAADGLMTELHLLVSSYIVLADL